MCMAIAKMKGVEIPKNFEERLDYSHSHNPDGMGIAYTKGNKVYIKKDFRKLKHLKKFIRRNIKKEDALLVHFRRASAGNVSMVNRHPFPIPFSEALETTADMAVVHNGTIHQLGDKVHSDTYLFSKDFLSDPLLRNNLEHPPIYKLIKKFIGSSRLAILTPEKIIFWGEWVEEDKIKYSNRGYKHYEVVAPIGFGDYYYYWDYKEPKKEKHWWQKSYDNTWQHILDKNKKEDDAFYCQVCGKKTLAIYGKNGKWLCHSCYEEACKEGGQK